MFPVASDAITFKVMEDACVTKNKFDKSTSCSKCWKEKMMKRDTMLLRP